MCVVGVGDYYVSVCFIFVSIRLWLVLWECELFEFLKINLCMDGGYLWLFIYLFDVSNVVVEILCCVCCVLIESFLFLW